MLMSQNVNNDATMNMPILSPRLVLRDSRCKKKSHDFVRFTVERKILGEGGGGGRGGIEIAEKKV